MTQTDDARGPYLKPCPFCGCELARGRLRMAACRTDSCYMRNFVIDMDDPGSVARWNTRADLAEGALATARREAFEQAAKCCEIEADKCDDAAKWGGSPKYIKACRDAAYAMRDRAHAIRALIAQEDAAQ